MIGKKRSYLVKVVNNTTVMADVVSGKHGHNKLLRNLRNEYQKYLYEDVDALDVTTALAKYVGISYVTEDVPELLEILNKRIKDDINPSSN